MASPQFKLESPAESLQHDFSDANQVYSPLFADEAMTPPSTWDVDSAGGSMMGESPGPESQKKPVKKRKSWGQQLPEPKTNLPPRYILDNKFTIVDMSANPHTRKRAKTEDEKEQRRVERVLRNRRAAQSSRERKRQEVEALEEQKRDIERRNQELEQQLAEARSHDAVQRRNQELEKMLEEANARMVMMQQQLEAATGGNMMVFHGSSASSPAHTEQFRSAPSPVTLSQELFSSRDAPERSSVSSAITLDAPITTQTVNPASLSPRTQPVLEESSASAFDLTQQPAALLCDLQCQSKVPQPWTASPISQLLAMICAVSWTFLSPLTQILDSLRTGSSLPTTPSILTTIIWLTTTTSPLMTTTFSRASSTTMNTTSPRSPRFSLRIRLLNRLLSCSPLLARPLMDATQGEMRLASEQQRSNNCLRGGVSLRGDHLGGNEASPSVESLATLLWAIQCFLSNEGQKKQPELDVTNVDVRQLSWELGNMFRHREIRMARARRGEFSFSSPGKAEQKRSLGTWRAALG